jgi:hypothetical protein
MKVKRIDGDLIRWTESFLSVMTVEMVIEDNVLQSHPVDAGVPQGSAVSLILLAIHTSVLIKWVEETVQAEGLSFVDDHRWIATGKDVNQVVRKLEACAAESIEWASRQDLQFDSAKKKAALFTRRIGHKNHLRPKLTAKIKVGDGFVRFNKEATRWLGVWMDAHLTFKKHYNRCKMMARAAEAQTTHSDEDALNDPKAGKGGSNSLCQSSCTIQQRIRVGPERDRKRRGSSTPPEFAGQVNSRRSAHDATRSAHQRFTTDIYASSPRLQAATIRSEPRKRTRRLQAKSDLQPPHIWHTDL